jgi:hypothetical protein
MSLERKFDRENVRIHARAARAEESDCLSCPLLHRYMAGSPGANRGDLGECTSSRSGPWSGTRDETALIFSGKVPCFLRMKENG